MRDAIAARTDDLSPEDSASDKREWTNLWPATHKSCEGLDVGELSNMEQEVANFYSTSLPLTK